MFVHAHEVLYGLIEFDAICAQMLEATCEASDLNDTWYHLVPLKSDNSHSSLEYVEIINIFWTVV